MLLDDVCFVSFRKEHVSFACVHVLKLTGMHTQHICIVCAPVRAKECTMRSSPRTCVCMCVYTYIHVHMQLEGETEKERKKEKLKERKTARETTCELSIYKMHQASCDSFACAYVPSSECGANEHALFLTSQTLTLIRMI